MHELPAPTLKGAVPATLSPAAYYAEYLQQARQLDGAITAVVRVVDETASADASTALFDTRLYGGAAVFAMLLTLMLIWFVSNSLVGPLRRLTAAAREMSQRQLPALVESSRPARGDNPCPHTTTCTPSSSRAPALSVCA